MKARPRPARSRIAGGVLGWLLLLAVWLLPAAPAQAHAYLLESTPSNGETIAQSPAAVVVQLSGGVTLPDSDRTGRVLDSEGNRVDAGGVELSADRTQLTIPLQPDLPDGVYIVSWTVISDDSHVMGGSIQFGVNVPATFVETVEAQPDRLLTTIAGILKGILYLGLVVGLGAPPAARLFGLSEESRRRLWSWARAGLAVAGAASLLQPLVQFLWVQSGLGADLYGTGTDASPIDWSGFGPSLGETYALAVWLRLLLLAIAFAILTLGHRLPDGRARTLTWVAITVAVAYTVAVNGHGGAGESWQLLAVVLHATGAIVWLGGLVVLVGLLLRRRLSELELRRFGAWSALAGTAVAVIVLSGLVQTAAQVQFPGALTSTTYGTALLLKLALVLAALALGASGWWWARRERRRADSRPAPGRTAALRRRVTAELTLGVAIVVLSGILSTLVPASADYRPVVSQTIEIGPYEVEVDIVNARTGSQYVRLRAVGDESAPPPAQLELEFSSEQNDVAGIEAKTRYRGTEPVGPFDPVPVRFQTAPVTVPLGGQWQLNILLVVDEWRQYAGVVDFTVEG